MQETVVNDRYSIVRTLGGGGMAKVYLAHDEILDRDVALKVLREHLAEDEEFAERFKREALSAAALSHPNIVSVYDRGQEPRTSYIAMEYVPGGTLEERISRDGPLEAGAATKVALQIAEALHAAHQRGVIHRDIKPHNVLLTSSGSAKVADFGIARAASAATISQRSMVLGTASYMSPEQAMGETVMPTSDLYSLGVVLYEMLTGELPYTAENPVAVSMKHVNDPLRPPRELNPEIPEELNALITKLLAKDPDGRYASAAQLADDLRRLRDGLPPINVGLLEEDTGATRVAPKATMPPAARPDRGLRTPWILTATLALVAILGGIAWALSQNHGDSVPPLERVAGVEVPSVKGLTQELAKLELDASGFEADVRLRESSAADAGKVLGQSPAAGERAGEGSTVVLNVGDGPSTVNVPVVVGLSVSEAMDALEKVGLNLGEQRIVPSDTAAEGIVVDQDQRAGTDVEPGTAVNVRVSSGPQPVAARGVAPGDPDQNIQPTATASATATATAAATATAPATTPAIEDDNSGPGSSDSGGSGPGGSGED
jgi:eukaryotic-like serine/threonine-protein kinase